MENTIKSKEERERELLSISQARTEENAQWDWFDNTIITTYQTCPRKAYFKFQKFFQSRRENSTLDFGRSYHKAKEFLLLGKPELVQGVIDAYNPPVDEDLRTKLKLEKAIKAYVTEKMPPRWEETLAVEGTLEVPIGGLLLLVKPDLVIKWRGSIFGLESKHTAKLISNYFDGFKRNSQIDAQLLGIRRKFGECKGIYVEATIVRKGGPTSKLREIEFLTDIISKPEDELKRSERYFEQWMLTIKEDKKFLENRKGCFAYGRPCEYLGLCSGNVEDPYTHYKLDSWDPRNVEEVPE